MEVNGRGEVMPSSTSLTLNPSFRWLRRAERQGPSIPPAREVVLRLSRGDDHAGLERLAELESRPLPRGAFVVAFADGDLVAAVPLDDDLAPLADPFRHTAALISLATQRAREIRKAEARDARGTARRLVRA
jgi:hypothetical protein